MSIFVHLASYFHGLFMRQYVSEFHSFLWRNNIRLSVYIMFCLSSVNGHLACFHLFTIVNNAAVNIVIDIFYGLNSGGKARLEKWKKNHFIFCLHLATASEGRKDLQTFEQPDYCNIVPSPFLESFSTSILHLYQYEMLAEWFEISVIKSSCSCYCLSKVS